MDCLWFRHSKKVIELLIFTKIHYKKQNTDTNIKNPYEKILSTAPFLQTLRLHSDDRKHMSP